MHITIVNLETHITTLNYHINNMKGDSCSIVNWYWPHEEEENIKETCAQLWTEKDQMEKKKKKRKKKMIWKETFI